MIIKPIVIKYIEYLSSFRKAILQQQYGLNSLRNLLYVLPNRRLYFQDNLENEFCLTHPDYNNLENVPTEFTPQEHSHDPDHTHANLAQLELVSDGDHDVRTDNPHSVTAAQTGAALTSHTHDYAPTSHTHDYAPTSHTHDYAPTSHAHPYALQTDMIDRTKRLGVWAYVTSSYAHTSGQVIPLAGELEDDNNYHSNVTNNSRFTIPATGPNGWYLITGRVSLILNSSDTYGQALVRLNGSTVLTASLTNRSGGNTVNINVAVVYKLAVNDYIEIIVGWSGSGTRTVLTDTHVEMVWLGSYV